MCDHECVRVCTNVSSFYTHFLVMILSQDESDVGDAAGNGAVLNWLKSLKDYTDRLQLTNGMIGR